MTNRPLYVEPAHIEEHKKGSLRAYALPPCHEIAARLQAGETVDTLAAEFKISRDALQRRLFKSGYNARGEVITEPPVYVCGWCGRRTKAASRTCRDCLGIEAIADKEPKDSHALTGGRWVPRGGTLVWDGPLPRDQQVGLIGRPIAKCGTESGYTRHQRRKEKACEACKRAKRDGWHRRKGQVKRQTWKRADLLAAYDKLRAKGLSNQEVADKLGTTVKAIHKAQARERRAEQRGAA